jgi:hypothetical protein
MLALDGDEEPNLRHEKHDVFLPGQFVCPQVYAIYMPLHQRLDAEVAMRALVQMALHPFSVTNRKNVFVYKEKKGNVFYLELGVKRRKPPRRKRRPTAEPETLAASLERTANDDVARDDDAAAAEDGSGVGNDDDNQYELDDDDDDDDDDDEEDDEDDDEEIVDINDNKIVNNVCFLLFYVFYALYHCIILIFS